MILGKSYTRTQFVAVSSLSSIHTSRVGFVPDTAVTGITTVYEVPKVGTIVTLVVVVVKATLTISAIIPGIDAWLEVTDVIVQLVILTLAPPGILTGIASPASS